ncbi:MAG: hypothetical protein KAI44_03245 [Methylococcales bacterium]|nr:hypothetical protein [Methylococcales bacterium]
MIEDILAERVIIVSYETVRRWCLKFGLDVSRFKSPGTGKAIFVRL